MPVRAVEEEAVEEVGAVEIGRVWNICCVGCKPVSTSNRFGVLEEADEMPDMVKEDEVPDLEDSDGEVADFPEFKAEAKSALKRKTAFKRIPKNKWVRFKGDEEEVLRQWKVKQRRRRAATPVGEKQKQID